MQREIIPTKWLKHLALSALVMGGAESGVSQTDTLRIDLSRVRSILLAELQVNNRPAYFLIDTGSGISLIDLAQASKFGFEVHPENGQGKIYSLGGTTHFMATSGLKLSYEGQRLRRGRLYTTDLRHLHDFGLPNRYTIAGILGADFFRKNKAILDFEKAQVVLTRR